MNGFFIAKIKNLTTVSETVQECVSVHADTLPDLSMKLLNLPNNRQKSHTIIPKA